MNNIAIIPARGGSKRILKKNIKNFLGKPIIGYSIDAALSCGLFDEVIVSTDDAEIVKISEQFGAKIPFMRSSVTSNDFATTFDVIEETVNKLHELGKSFENICCIYPCAPFINKEILLKTYKMLKKNDFDSVFPVVQYSTPIQRALKIKDDKIVMSYPEFQKTRSQDLEMTYFDAAQFYWLNTLKVMTNKKIYSQNSGCIVLNELNAHDIDNESDWKIAELKYSLL